jgi:hypothetical protein
MSFEENVQHVEVFSYHHNVYSRTVRVFATRTQNPLYDVYSENTTGQEQNIHTPIQVAFFAIKERNMSGLQIL